MAEQYARIVTNIEEIEQLTDLIRIRGTDTDGAKTSLVSDTILEFGDETVETKFFDPMDSIWGHVRGSFDGVRSPGRLVIGNISDFRGYLSRFGEHTEITMEERSGAVYITFNDEDRKEGGYPSKDETHIKSTKDVETLPFEYDPTEGTPGDGIYPGSATNNVYLDSWFRCDVAEIQDVLKDGDTTEVREYPISIEDGDVVVRVGSDEGWIETDFVADAGEGVATSVYAYGMDNVFSNLTGTASVFLLQDGPMWVHADDQNGYTVDYMIAEDTS